MIGIGACAKHDTGPAASDAAEIAATASPRADAPVWTGLLPQGGRPYLMRVTGAGVTIATGDETSFVSTSDGQTLWKAPGDVTAIALGPHLAFLGTANGAAFARRLDDGDERWRRSEACVPKGKVTFIFVHGGDVVLGCAGGGIAKIDGDSGVVAARARPLMVDQVDGIAAAGDCAYVVQGFASGAITRRALAIVGCGDLHVIMAARDDTSYVGAVGATAVLQQAPCNGCLDVYRPATIVRVDTRSGASSNIDLAPEPERYPQGKIPGIATAMVAGSRLYLGIGTSLYEYDDVLHLPSAPARLLDDLSRRPDLFSDGFAGLTERDGSGYHERIVDLKARPMRTVWHDESDPYAMFSYFPEMASGVVRVSIPPMKTATTFVRLADGAVMHGDGNVASFASDGTVLVATSPVRSMSGGRFDDVLEGYRWP